MIWSNESQAADYPEDRNMVPAFFPAKKKKIQNKCVFIQKHDSGGNVTSNGARLVQKGFHQKQGMDHDEDFASVAKYTTLRFLLYLKVLRKWLVLQLDVKNALLNATLHQEIYVKVRLVVNLEEKSGECLLINKAMYGLKKAEQIWNKKLDFCLKELSFTNEN